MKTTKREIGDRGEEEACCFLRNNGFEVLERNYLRKWGEIDVIARHKDRYHFIEVKSVTHGTFIRPEENMHGNKLKRLSRAIQTYILEKKIDADWQLDLVIVRFDQNGVGEVEVLDNIII